MKNDLIEVAEACIDGTLDQVDLQFEDNAAVCVVLASEGYRYPIKKACPSVAWRNSRMQTVITASMQEPNLTEIRL